MTVDGTDLSITLRVENTSPVSSPGGVQGQATAAEREQRALRRPRQKDELPRDPEQLEPEQSGQDQPNEDQPEEDQPDEDQPQHRIDSLA
jgi:hypothetical protein